MNIGKTLKTDKDKQFLVETNDVFDPVLKAIKKYSGIWSSYGKARCTELWYECTQFDIWLSDRKKTESKLTSVLVHIWICFKASRKDQF